MSSGPRFAPKMPSTHPTGHLEGQCILVRQEPDWNHQKARAMKSSRTNHIDCVVLTAFDSAFSFLRNTWFLAGIRTHHAKTVEQADFLLIATEATVLLSDTIAVDCSWRSALNMLSEHHPQVAMVVMADPADRPHLEDALTLGVCGFIWKPIQFDAATKLIGTAHQACLDGRDFREETFKAACRRRPAPHPAGES